ncbi:Gfo/Idh/MocA family oxidoreductase, partial [bacterium]|nr:Gfo/Idh/MocA family oxidoreductase [bacterium]
MTDRLKIGFIGAGFISSLHAQSFQYIRHADICGIVDKKKIRARKLARLCEKSGVGKPKIFATITDMVKDKDIDAVWINTPNFTRIPIMEEIADAVLKRKAKLVGVACEKPLGRNVSEAKRMVSLMNETGLLHGYLEDLCFAPSITRGKDILWKRGAAITGEPYLARCVGEHGGPHDPWFWQGNLQGGGVLNDMMCHTLEAARFLLTPPGKKKSSIKPVNVTCDIANLKWLRKEYIDIQNDKFNGKFDYANTPSEDYARATIVFESPEKNPLIAELTTSWCFNGPGLKLGFELIGPEYYMQINSLTPELHVFFSRRVKGKEGEDFVQKQAAEQGLMP